MTDKPSGAKQVDVPGDDWVPARSAVDPEALTDHPGQILIIDDEPSVRRYIRIVLKGLGLRLMEASTGEEGVSMAREHRPELVIVDLNLPAMSGLDVLADLGNDPVMRQTPAILMSGGGLDESVSTRRLSAPCKLLSKPFLPDDLTRCVKALLPWMVLPAGAHSRRP